MSKYDQEVHKVRVELRRIADEVWSVAKTTDDRESSTRLKALSTLIHHQASLLGG